MKTKIFKRLFIILDIILDIFLVVCIVLSSRHSDIWYLHAIIFGGLAVELTSLGIKCIISKLRILGTLLIVIGVLNLAFMIVTIAGKNMGVFYVNYED